MVLAEDIRKIILKLAEERGPDTPFDVSEIARQVDQTNWRMLIDQVKFVADVLIQEGKITATPHEKVSSETVQFQKRK